MNNPADTRPPTASWASIDPSSCNQEPIHTPSAIQPYGALLACHSSDLRIVYASENLESIVGVSARNALGGILPDVLGTEASRSIEAVLGASRRLPSSRLSVQLPRLDKPSFHVLVHCIEDLICVEIEPSLPHHQWDVLSQRMEAVIESLQRTTTQQELCAAAVDEMRALTGFDHVMIYRFHEDGHGEVIAEDKIEAMPSHLNLHFPASDIPEQARALYMLQRTRLIADVNYIPVPLLTQPSIAPASPLDMTYSSLRSVSPIHLQYLRNMKIAASYSISLIHEGKLWGLIICQHRTPMLIAPEVRSLCDLLGQIISILTGVTQSNERYVEQLINRSRLEELELLMAPVSIVADVLADHPEQLLGAVAATGAIIHLQGHTRVCGFAPPVARTLDLLRYLQDEATSGLAFTSDISRILPQLSDISQIASGGLLIELGDSRDDFILWFRPDMSQTILWAGNPSDAKVKNLTTGSIGPRESFASWQETEKGHATPWTLLEIAMTRSVQQLLQSTLVRHADIRLAKLSYLDVLTNLPNRRVILERLTKLLEEPGSADAFLIFMDIDRFKSVNDSFGHSIGDELLIQVGLLLTRCAGPIHVVARLGGDEFVILCEMSTLDQTKGIAAEIVQSFRNPFLLDGRSFRCTPSIGVAAIELSGTSVAEVMNAADSAMYEAKHLGGNQFCVYEVLRPENHVRQMQLEQDLFLAIDRNEMKIHFQPQVTAADNQIIGFEALLRWEHPRYNHIPPSEFIPMSEHTGYIQELGAWVLRQSLQQISHWRHVFYSDLFVAVNVSVKQLGRGDFVSGLEEALRVSGMPSNALHIEITESILLEAHLQPQLDAIQSLGIEVSIDDFGTGYSSLSYLQRLAFSEIKLDRTFLAGVGKDDRKTLLFQAIIRMAHTLNLKVVAEGIEDGVQLRCIRDCSCDSAQGYFLAKPMSPIVIEHLFRGAWANGTVSPQSALN